MAEEKWYVELDKLDRKIVEEILEHEDTTLADLARRLRKSRTTVEYRLNHVLALLGAKRVLQIPYDRLKGIEMAIVKIRVIAKDEKEKEKIMKEIKIAAKEVIDLGQRGEYLVKLISTNIDNRSYVENLEWLRMKRKYPIEIIETYITTNYVHKKMQEVNLDNLMMANNLILKKEPGIIKKRKIVKG